MAASSTDGVLPIDKPAGPTSHDIVARARKALGIRRIGHTGTLDPFASGLLLLCIGRATRLAEYLTGLPKTYEATLRLGVRTDTDDLTGAVVSESDAWQTLSREAIEEALLELRGTYDQVPPAYSARKVGGERAYRIARAGATPELEPAEVRVYDLEVTRVALPEVDFTVRCSAGTYIRAIARDAGERLGVGAHLSALRRTSIGEFGVAQALPADSLEDEVARAAAFVSPVDAVAHLPQLDVVDDDALDIRHGRTIAAPSGLHGTVAITSAGALLAIGESDGSVIRPRKVFADD